MEVVSCQMFVGPVAHALPRVRRHLLSVDENANRFKGEAFLAWDLRRVGLAQFPFGFGVASFVQLRFPGEQMKRHLIALMCADMREVAVERKVGAVDENVFENVGVATPGGDPVWREIVYFFQCPQAIRYNMCLALKGWIEAVDTEE